MIYDVFLDEQNEQVVELVVTVLCAQRRADGSVAPPEEALSKNDHVAFFTRYRFSDAGAVQPFVVPEAAARLLR